ncbi:HpcH/HpaI aldolase/citrate lyase family protein [Chloroflexota bacterium]
MHKNRVKEIMSRGEIAFFASVGFADPAVVEIIGLAGLDAARVDMEHTPFDLQTVEEMIRACEVVGITSDVRVPDNDPKLILRILDMGAQMIKIPHIGGKEDALAAVKAVRYAPLGDRGIGTGTRAARYGAVSKKEHMETSNSEILLSVLIEDKKAFDEIEEIASIEGLDLIAVGLNDITQAFGFSGPHDPRLKETVENVANTIKRVGKAKLNISMGHPGYPMDIAEVKRLGIAYTHVQPNPVGRLLKSFTQSMKEIREELEKLK